MENGVFYMCTGLQTVIFQGSNPPSCGYMMFDWCDALRSVCVPINYKSSYFCDKTVYANSSAFDHLRSANNHCNEVMVCSKTNATTYKRANATEWESKSQGCYEYKCLNETGGVILTCGNDADKICLNDECVARSTVEGERWVVEVTLNEVYLKEFNSTWVIETISDATGIEADKIKINLDIDGTGKIMRVIVLVDDQNAATIISDALSECLPKNATSRNNVCAGVLLKIKSAQVMQKTLSAAVGAPVMIFVTIISMLLMLLI